MMRTSISDRFLIQTSADPNTDPRLFLYDTQQIFKSVFCVDFTTRPIQTRIRNNKKNPEALIRACGLSLKKKSETITLLDLTAGFGLDSFLLASFYPNLKLTLLENNPIIYQLLQSGFKHAEKFFPEITARCTVIQAHHIEFLKPFRSHAHNPIPKYDIIYLDPMFPTRTKSARVKKYAELLQILTHADPQTDLNILLHLARQCAQQRVVLKRPKTAPMLETPVFSLLGMRGQSCRFDVYTTIA
jgi:16S rRNA (guanine1516-N2)-methyltransferase